MLDRACSGSSEGVKIARLIYGEFRRRMPHKQRQFRLGASQFGGRLQFSPILDPGKTPVQANSSKDARNLHEHSGRTSSLPVLAAHTIRISRSQNLLPRILLLLRQDTNRCRERWIHKAEKFWDIFGLD
jgi:hypothetical protein